MKKPSILVLLIFTACPLFAQTWTGTTTTKAAIGTTTYENSRLTIMNVQNAPGPSSAIKILNGANNTYPPGNIFEIWNGLYQSFMGQNGSVISYNPEMIFWVNNNSSVGIKSSLRIGSTAANGSFSNYKLSVDGDMIAKRCVIQVTNWADYVFAKDYVLPPLSEVEQYIETNKHLPGVPDQKEVLANGIEIGKMNEILLKKIEELTLYTIRLQKEMDQLKGDLKIRDVVQTD